MEADPFLQSFDSSDLQIAKEFLTNWLPFVTKDLCGGCAASIRDRIKLLSPDEQNQEEHQAEEAGGGVGVEESGLGDGEDGSGVADGVDECCEASLDGWKHIKATGWDTDPATESPKVRMSWADELEEEEEEEARKNSLEYGMEDGKGEMRQKKTGLSREQRERIRFTGVGRKKDFVCLERVDGKIVNILEGIELHTGVFSAAEQKKIVDFVYELQLKGRNNELGEHTYSEQPETKDHTSGQGCATIQFGCCYSYMEQNENPPGILRNAAADPIPNLFKLMIKRLIGWHVMPISCVPDCCSVNIYEPGHSVQPNIESNDFVRPFCTVSFLSECDIIFGFNLKVTDAGEVEGSTPISLPIGSVLIFNGKGANLAKHWVQAVPSKRISITFRKMDENKRPVWFKLEPDLQNIRPYDLRVESSSENNEKDSFVGIRSVGRAKKFNGRSNGAKGRRNFRNDGASVFDRITPTKKSSHSSVEADFTIKHRSFLQSEYEGGLQVHPDEPGEEVQERSHHGWKNEEGGRYNRNEFSNDRSVRMQQKRIVITRNLDREDDFFSRRSSESNSVQPSQVRVRTLRNNPRRVRMSQ
ncbi:uncharacterized protein LOC110028850 [Phalaenopsis equestris]|uniref:uncharacterized protein LOC110028850 n=1 Tax=Phalaenopsis equestris TaxID=78828 RepID=UPI0009E4881A|nr:uncharacterized protein LOC110028850 [Phalaenopsis equestris]